MISSVRGEVLGIDLDHAVVEVGGVGLAVHATPSTLATLRRGEQAALATALIVREESLTLYGFADADSRALFGLLQTVTGVGPRLALATLAVLDPDRLRAAIADEDVTTLTQVPGIGKKGAERLIIELRDKIGGVTSGGGGIVVGTPVRDQVIEALQGLGFPARQAEQAVERVLTENEAADTPTVLRRALTTLGRGR